MAGQQVGDWQFDAASGELSRGSECRRLEPRASQTLQLLIDARGKIVTQDEIIAKVWGGRSLSENSVSVVISQLRRVLGDDARRPVIIETMPKRGYRLAKAAANTHSGSPAAPRGFRWAAGLLLMLTVVGIGAWSGLGQASEKPVIMVLNVVNDTGNSAYGPHARATSELIVTQLSRRGFDVRRTPNQQGLRMASKLVMWNGAPSLGITVTDDQNRVRWAAMMKGGPSEVPHSLNVKLSEFQKRFSAI